MYLKITDEFLFAFNIGRLVTIAERDESVRDIVQSLKKEATNFNELLEEKEK